MEAADFSETSINLYQTYDNTLQWVPGIFLWVEVAGSEVYRSYLPTALVEN